MSALYRAVEETVPPGSRVVAVDRDALYGLQYYLEGDLDRVWTDRAEEEPSSLRSYVGRIAGASASDGSDDAPGGYVFVAREGVVGEEALLCATPELTCRTAEAGEGWRLWLVRTASPDAGG
jgi:hypothetical protein